MKNKLLCYIAFAILFVMSFIQSVQAEVSSTVDIYNRAKGIDAMSKYDYFSFVNKQELIGQNREKFIMYSNKYKSSSSVVVEDLRKIIILLEDLDSGKSETSDVNAERQKLYKQADRAIYNYYTQTVDYILSLSVVMPTITYQRYMKKFQDLYNSQKISEQKLTLK